MSHVSCEQYREEAKRGIADPVLQKGLAMIQGRLGPETALSYQNLPEGPGLRLKAYDIRRQAIENLDILLETLAQNIRKNGGHVFFAEDDQAAVKYCLQVAQKHHVRQVVKGKSMVTEEIGLNEALTSSGIEVSETDLGEFIIQLAGERPSHIIAPAIHRTRKEVGKLFSEKLNIAYQEDIPQLTQAARKALREKFIAADMGITGCNLACAETGHIMTVSNEGNIRMSTTLPKVHLAFMGMERIAARLEDIDILLRLLCRGAAAQNMATYASFVGGPRSAEQSDGPETFHLVIIDNGRSRLLADKAFREMLYCIRCGACLNVCPVYSKIGGHAYGYAYSGPMGAVVTPLLVGINRAKDLCQGETLCGACQDACPININIPRMLLELRAKLAQGDPDWDVKRENFKEKLLYSAWSWMIQNRWLYDLGLKMAATGQWLLPKHGDSLHRLPPPLHGWTESRDFKSIAPESFKDRWSHIKKRKTEKKLI